jgi:hypothetical protein
MDCVLVAQFCLVVIFSTEYAWEQFLQHECVEYISHCRVVEYEAV